MSLGIQLQIKKFKKQNVIVQRDMIISIW